MDTTALFQLSYGVFAVSSTDSKGRKNAQISNTVFQINSEPPTIEIVINKLNFTHEILTDAAHFGIAVLNTETPMTYIGRFGFKSGRNIDKFEGLNIQTTPNGIAIPLEYTVAWLECKIYQKVDARTHTIFFGEVSDCGTISKEFEPMTYAYYHKVKKGKEPETAPTFVRSK